MDVVSWIVVVGVIVLAAVGLGLWNRWRRRSSPSERFDRDGEASVRDAEADVDRAAGRIVLGNQSGGM
jgi:hypothetical protein